MVTHGEKWGAGRAASRLFDCLAENNFDVKLLLAKRGRNLNNILQIGSLQKFCIFLSSRIDKVICNLLEPDNPNWKSASFVGVLNARALNKSNFEVINFHWVGHGLISLRQLVKITKPVIFTINDEWLLNPISHYPYRLNSEKTIIGLLRRRILKNRLQMKETLVQKENVTIVSVSKEIAEKFKHKYSSKVNQIFVIPNPVNTQLFFPEVQLNFQKQNFNFDIPFIFYAGGTKDHRKGWDLLEKSLEFCGEKFKVLAVGAKNRSGIGRHSQIEIIGIENISNLFRLRKFYSNAKLTAVPSRVEALPQVATECISCGTPVVGFNIGGLEDIIVKSRTGILVPKFDVKLFAMAIDQIMALDKSNFSKECLNYSIENFSYQSVADKYRKVLVSIRD
jgi:glycosyltransferase involved in cell wall biosynthesis